MMLNLIYTTTPVCAAVPKSICISTDDHPPLLQTDASPLKKQGIMTDIVREAFRTQGIQVEYVSVPAARIVWSLLDKKVAATVGPMGWFNNRKECDKVHYIPIYPATFHFYFMKKRFPKGFFYESLEELKEYKIGWTKPLRASLPSQ
ncbi:MAG: hypothetical protein KKD44_05935 [Proteobacteria bacterium]|nr:hypothetical protein [Pseudomonadota bacterium]